MNNPPTGPLGILGDDRGTAYAGDTLTARPNAITDADGIDQDSWEYQWTRNGNPITGETFQTYLITHRDEGAALAVRSMYLDGQGNKETVISGDVTVPKPIAPKSAAPLTRAQKIEQDLGGLYRRIMGREGRPEGLENLRLAYESGVEISELALRMEANRDGGAT